jgi:pilus assembly protein CpaB
MARHFGGINQNRQADRARAVVLVSVFFVIIFSVTAFYLLSTAEKPEEAAPARVVVEREAEIKMVDVLVPVRDIEAGDGLEATMFRRDSRPVVGVSEFTVRDFEEIRGQYARSLIVKGQPLSRQYITAVKPVNQLTASIPEGYRAVSINVNTRSAVEGFVRPGARVDVVWASRIRGRPGVTIIVENAKVLSADRATADSDNNPNTPVPTTVTLLVTSADASKIQLATTAGELTLQLRGDQDSGKNSVGSSITIDDLFGGSKVKPKDEPDNVEGEVTLGGEKFYVVRGKLVPKSRKRKK